MDNETKQIFEQLIEAINNNRVDSSQLVEAVEKLNGPDWWMIVLTTINIVAFILVAYAQLKQQKYQTKLQEEQIQQQEYELYRRMYTQVFEMDFFNKTILLRIVAILVSNEDNKLRLKLIDDIWREYEKRSEEFTQCTLDMELKKCGEGIDAKYYFNALQASRKVIQLFKYFIQNNLLSFEPSLAYNPQIDNHDTPPEVFIDMILRIYKGRNPHILKNELLAYASIVDKTKQTQLLKVIKGRITHTEIK